jgi:cytochrome c oxidase cbb3-type subunit III
MRIALSAAVAVLASAPCRAQPEGQTLYQSNCAGCHGLDARGGEHAPNIATAQRVQELTDADLLRIVRDGIPASGMPAFGSRFNSEQISAVSGYLRSLRGDRKTAPVPGNPETGRTLFSNKAGCAECHMVAGQGGFIAADLSSYAAIHSVEQIREAIVNPNKNLDPHHPIVTVVTKNGRRYEGVIRNEDSSSMQLEGRDGAFYLFEKSTLLRITREKRSYMPADYGAKLSPSELNDLISYLIRIAVTGDKETADDSE